MAKRIKSFEVRNDDVSFRVSCQNYGSHLEAAIKNLLVADNETKSVDSVFSTDNDNVKFYFDDIEQTDRSFEKQAVFFENTDYPMRVIPVQKGVKILRMDIAGHSSSSAAETTDDGSLLYGMVNFHNQVGKTDFRIVYEKNGHTSDLMFRTEVLSYKLDYRTDLRQIIRDIEEEYSMLSYSFLKQTYLSFKSNNGTSSDLIWWQIFSQHYEFIMKAVQTIINNPRRRLKYESRFERAERLKTLTPDIETEYSIFKSDVHHLYRTDEMFLSKDTVENRFLKFAVKEMHRRFSIIREHIKASLKVKDYVISDRLSEMDERLARVCNHPFFRQIGAFKGFTQDSLVMKRARGYSDIYREWILLQCGYELEESMSHLEVKDISELYEIWCFIKVKNMIQKIVGKKVVATSSGKNLTSSFIKQLVYGSQSEVKFCDGDIELATITYNAQVEKDEDELVSAIANTSTFTTRQRPDIVLKLSKRENDDIDYTYLFDAKYRLSDTRIENHDVPPQDAINQMHRYRDAIYYSGDDGDANVKKEIIGGYVLYPGNLSRAEYENSYYNNSANKVGIGAFPLRPGSSKVDSDGNLYIDPTSSEAVLYEKLASWLLGADRKRELLKNSIPQKGLFYTDSMVANNVLLVSVLASDSPRPELSLLKSGKATFYKLSPNFAMDINLNEIKYFAPVYKSDQNSFYGYYRITGIYPKQIQYGNSSHMGIEIGISDFAKVQSETRLDVFLGSYKQMVVSGKDFQGLINSNVLNY